MDGNTMTTGVFVEDYKLVQSNNDDLKRALLTGPVVVSMEMDDPDFMSYTGGILNSHHYSLCSNKNPD